VVTSLRAIAGAVVEPFAMPASVAWVGADDSAAAVSGCAARRDAGWWRLLFRVLPPMSSQTAAEHELAQLMVESLNLEDVDAGAIDPEAPLFNTGLGLDSIDALELALAISKRYGFQLRSDNDDNRRIFASLRALSEHVEQNKAA
jgi:acyl carrier protein